eukprot:2835678-Rhodomonas_salina.2
MCPSSRTSDIPVSITQTSMPHRMRHALHTISLLHRKARLSDTARQHAQHTPDSFLLFSRVARFHNNKRCGTTTTQAHISPIAQLALELCDLGMQL